MIKHILNLDGIDPLSRTQQSSILGGVDKCCIRIPGQIREEGWCNSNPKCSNANCAC